MTNHYTRRKHLQFCFGALTLLAPHSSTFQGQPLTSRSSTGTAAKSDSPKEWVTDNRYYIIDETRYTWYLRPNTILKRNGISYETNSFGLRDIEFSLTKAPGSFRIVCLGDSVTYGEGVSFENTYEQLLERKLRARGIDANVINAGIGSHRAWQGLERLEKDVIRFHPDVVAVSFGLNEAALGSQTLWEEWRSKLEQGSDNLEKQRSKHSMSSLPRNQPEGLVPSVPINEYKEHLKALVTQLQKRTQARVYLVTFNPISDDNYRPEWTPQLRKRQHSVIRQYRDQVLQMGKELGLKTVDVYQHFEESSESLLTPDGVHPNAKGMLVYAEELYDQIMKDLR